MGPINKTHIKDILKNILKIFIMGPINKTHIKDIYKKIY